MNISEKIALLRTSEGLTQEDLAVYTGVSRQAVQKWESGVSKPDLDNLVAIAKRFQVTVNDLLTDDASAKSAEDLRFSKRYLPNYAALNEWEMYSSNIMTEFEQLEDEGRNIAQYKKLAAEIAALPGGKAREEMADYLAGMMYNAPIKEGYRYYEPSSLEEIKVQRACINEVKSSNLDKENYLNKIKGAWLGRICGCLLGKPIEGIRKADLDFLLKKTNNFPLNRYILKSDLTEAIYEKCKFPLKDRCFADTVEYAPADDDTNYTVLAAAKLIDVYGRAFTPANVAKCWLDNQPKEVYCTAERVAFVNFVNGFEPPISALYKNPFREWIGAQIRGDYFGYINPGNTTLAAEMAWRDASISHVKNGIYGEMFVAAMISHAAVCNNMEEIINFGLNEIPKSARLYHEMTKLLENFKDGKSAEDCLKWIHKNYDENKSHHWCHTIPNALIVVMALIYGDLNFTKTICLAVEAAFDTDCNGATAGSILGMILGGESIPAAWTKVLNGKLETSIFGVGTITIDSLCDLTLKHSVL